MRFLNWIKQIYIPATCEDLMLWELDTAKRNLLLAETSLDYAESMVLYNKQRIERLTTALQKCSQ